MLEAELEQDTRCPLTFLVFLFSSLPHVAPMGPSAGFTVGA